MFAGTLRSLRSFPHDVQRLILVSALMSLTVDGVFPVIFNLYILRMGFGADLVGLVNSVALLVYSVASLPAGAIAVWLGARNTLVWGTVLGAVTTIALGLTDLLPRGMQPGWLMVMFSLNYIGVAFFFVNASPAIVNMTAHTRRARVVSVQNAISNFFSFVGGPLAGFVPAILVATLGLSLADPAAYRVPLLIAGAIYAVGVVVILRVRIDETQSTAHLEPSPERGAPNPAIAFGATLLMLSLLRALQGTGTAAGVTFFNVYMDEALGVSPQVIGLLVAGGRLLAVFAALAVPLFVKRLGASNAAVVGATIVGLSLMPLALAPNWMAGGAGLIALHGGTSVRYAAFFVWSMAISPSRLRTTVAGAGEFAGGMAFALVSFLGGLAIVRYGFTELFLVSGLVTLAGAALNWLYAWRRERPFAGAAAPPLQIDDVTAASVLPGTPLPDVPPAALAPLAVGEREMLE